MEHTLPKIFPQPLIISLVGMHQYIEMRKVISLFNQQMSPMQWFSYIKEVMSLVTSLIKKLFSRHLHVDLLLLLI